MKAAQPHTQSRSLIALTLAALALGCASTEPTPDIAIVGGRVMDPASGTDAVRTVLIRDDRIVGITDQPVGVAGRVIDATGLVVAPGFVDILAHIPNDAEPQRFKITDGVTTVVSMHGGPVDIEGWYSAFEAEGSLVNYGTTVGHAELRRAAGATDRYAPATPEQIEAMRPIAAEAIAAGAVGIGFGINYVPGASYEEIVAMFDVAARHDVPAHVHSRYKGSVFPETIVQSVQELIAAAAITGASTQVVHLASSGIGSMAACLNMIEGARAHGVDIMADIYPYQANSTRLESALYDEGWQERFGGITYDSIMLVETGERLNEQTFGYWREQGATIITFFIPKDEIVMALNNPNVMVASDGVIVNGKGHPRGAGSFSRVLGRFARDEGIITLMEALKKITIMPAQRIEGAAESMKERGRLSVGAFADITIFDPTTIIDRATFREPAQYSAGIHYVLVNGTLVVDNGELVSGVAPGKAVRR
jgi:N-acyl-D-aspartate/D-glutamate deacylase